MSNYVNSGAGAVATASSSSYACRKSRWIFTPEQLANSPSRRDGMGAIEELHLRQSTALMIQEMGQLLRVSQLCINTGIVYMHRFYTKHSFKRFDRNSMASACLYLSAKVEEQERRMGYIIKASNKCSSQTTNRTFEEQREELILDEQILLQTLGFDITISHTQAHVLRTCKRFKVSKSVKDTAYVLCSNNLLWTTMCLQYRPTMVACFCIYMACKRSQWVIPALGRGIPWFYHVNKNVTLELLNQLDLEFNMSCKIGKGIKPTAGGSQAEVQTPLKTINGSVGKEMPNSGQTRKEASHQQSPPSTPPFEHSSTGSLFLSNTSNSQHMHNDKSENNLSELPGLSDDLLKYAKDLQKEIDLETGMHVLCKVNKNDKLIYTDKKLEGSQKHMKRVVEEEENFTFTDETMDHDLIHKPKKKKRKVKKDVSNKGEDKMEDYTYNNELIEDFINKPKQKKRKIKEDVNKKLKYKMETFKNKRKQQKKKNKLLIEEEKNCEHKDEMMKDFDSTPKKKKQKKNYKYLDEEIEDLEKTLEHIQREVEEDEINKYEDEEIDEFKINLDQIQRIVEEDENYKYKDKEIKDVNKKLEKKRKRKQRKKNKRQKEKRKEKRKQVKRNKNQNVANVIN